MISLLSRQSRSRLSHRIALLALFSAFTFTTTAPRAKMHIILDFDGTITANDTIGVLAASAVSFQTQRDSQSGGTGVDWDARWKRVVDDYLADHQRHTASYTPTEPSRTTLEHELDYLRSLRDVDYGSIRALYDAGLFRGMAPHRLAEAGQVAVQAGGSDGVRVRPGFSEFLSEVATRQKWPVSIVSVNWSDAWIRGVVSTQTKGDERIADDVKIYTNKISESGAIVSNYERVGAEDTASPVSSCLDKLEALKVAAVNAAQLSATIGINEPVVYMGDSTTDLECLIHAGQGDRGGGGIVLADGDGRATSKLLKALARLGYNVPHVSETEKGRFRETKTAANDAGPRLAWARDFDEIMASQILG
ncbi:hypothetical protein F503_02414 [Ophiostoma piceae UAMH 11346]|uniref:Haloacid dehalogenase-like hydrolase n=1 Tax=Ophiostoma piceae (strain UAMH 11346) TaxID=1262450 RepID=S3C3D3_OPHP1|nr:hypothetical protein F503_02414 [Ophiostoma piceae UAMH 11346]